MSGSTLINMINCHQFNELLQEKNSVDLIDVRTPLEFKEVHIKTAKNRPLDNLQPEHFVNSLTISEERPLYVICRSGTRGMKAVNLLRSAGMPFAINVSGGIQAWEEAGYPVERTKTIIGLERQVRIAAGTLVLLGIALSMIHPWWIFLSAFVGTGLIFAGITDFCGMGLLLAKLPWNK